MWWPVGAGVAPRNQCSTWRVPGAGFTAKTQATNRVNSHVTASVARWVITSAVGFGFDLRKYSPASGPTSRCVVTRFTPSANEKPHRLLSAARYVLLVRHPL